MEKLSLYFAWYISERPRRGLTLLNRCVPRSGTCGNTIISPSLTLLKGATLASVRPLFEVESIYIARLPKVLLRSTQRLSKVGRFHRPVRKEK